MNLEPETLMAGLVVSALGFVFFRYGKRQERLPQMLGGVAMMAVPFFGWAALVTLAVGGGLAAALWLALRMGL